MKVAAAAAVVVVLMNYFGVCDKLRATLLMIMPCE
jgi:hypothetical protein